MNLRKCIKTDHVRIGLKLITAIVATELAIMLFFSAVHIDVLMPPLLVNLSDAILLGIAASGMIYFWVVRPMKSVEEFRNIEKDLRESEKKYSQASREWEETFNSITDMVTVHDKDWNIIRSNKAAEKILGLSHPGNTPTAKCFTNYHGTASPPEGCLSCDCLRTGAPATFEYFEPYLNLFLEMRAIPRVDSDNRVIGLIHVVRDVTARRKTEEEKLRLEEQLRQSQKMEAIGQLAGGIAHDFNNILSAIIGFGSLVHMKMAVDDPQRPNIEQILEAGDRASQLTRSLLAFSRKQVMNLRPVDVNDIIKRIEKFLVRIIGEDIELKTFCADNDLYVVADNCQIEQVLMNLATNARDAMPKGGRLSIQTDQVLLDDSFVRAHGYGKPGVYAVVSMSDTGAGMDEETSQRVFEPFFTTKDAGRGTGLGLAMVYGIIKQHEGFINVFSETGKGTVFRIYLPVVKHAKTANEQITVADYPTGGKETVLVAEDDEALRRLMTAILKEFGYTVIVAADGEDAVSQFLENAASVRLVLLDLVMPKKSGMEVYTEIRKVNPGLPVLFASGYNSDFIRDKGIPLESMDLLMKPVSPKDLLRKVRLALDKRMPAD